MKQFNWHCDDAHEWLEVDIDYLKISGLEKKSVATHIIVKRQTRLIWKVIWMPESFTNIWGRIGIMVMPQLLIMDIQITTQ